MKSTALQTNHHEIETLKNQLQEAKEKKELVALRNELEKTIQETANTPNEFDGAMQVPDSIEALKTKRKVRSFVELLLQRLGAMLSPRPVIGNIIAIGVAIASFLYLQYNVLALAHLGKYQHYIGIGLLVFAALQIVKSGTRSLILPIIATVAGSIISHQLTSTQSLLGYGPTFYQYVMITGIIGLGVGVLSID